MLILKIGYRQVTCNINKQEQSTPNGRELSRLLALMCEYWRYSRLREARAESSDILKSTNGDYNAQFSVFG